MDQQPHHQEGGPVCKASLYLSFWGSIFIFVLLQGDKNKYHHLEHLMVYLALFSLFLTPLTFTFGVNCMLYGPVIFNLLPPWVCLRVFAPLLLQPEAIYHLTTHENIITSYSLFRSQLNYHILRETFPSPQTGCCPSVLCWPGTLCLSCHSL